MTLIKTNRIRSVYLALIVIDFLANHSTGIGQQLAIKRISQMPDFPHPYEMRNWKDVAKEYDSFVFDMNKTGSYLPLVWLNYNTINYPSNPTFGLNTVVGTTVPSSAEAINCLPALIGASLIGIDKTNQNGINWVAMSKEWFNKNNHQDIYRNHWNDNTNDDMWYETMPSVFFYQLSSLYPAVTEFSSQFMSTADRWLQVVQIIGGSTTPWKVPNFNHRGFDFSTMSPYDGKVPFEPEAAGAVAWILYNAYIKTGIQKYRVGAEQSMEFLNNQTVNPAYELQLSYGVYTAARMNAELGTNYDVEKMINWCFDIGPLRNWGAIVGRWGLYDCSGLIGEVNGSNDYAFFMNTVEQIGALVPLVRYDSRFAQAIGKWVLNAANALRLFYPRYLPQDNQDQSSYLWSMQYDTLSCIAHEAIHQFSPQSSSVSPYASGDAVTGGWGKTNLTLYSSSHVGILGAIIDTTNVPGILKLDLLKTDYFHRAAYPSFLLYNPDSIAHDVNIDMGSGMHDLYDAVAHQFIASGVTGTTQVHITSKQAIIVVIIPSGGAISFAGNKTIVNGIIVDYNNGTILSDHPPRIKSLAAIDSTILINGTTRLFCSAEDIDGDFINYRWKASGGLLVSYADSAVFTSPDSAGNVFIECIVTDPHGLSDSTSIVLNVVKHVNHSPVIKSILGPPRVVNLGGRLSLKCLASDPDSDKLSYFWSSDNGIISAYDSLATWTAPDFRGYYYILCKVMDPYGGSAKDSIGILVKDFSSSGSGKLIAFYPFDGNANDASGTGNNGVLYRVIPDTDRFGKANAAFFFDGGSSNITVPSSQSLNFTRAMTVNFWMVKDGPISHEEYIISHGSWQNRWKVSLTTDSKIRFTIRTNNPFNNGINDVDSDGRISPATLYNVTLLYDGLGMEIYLNGELDAYSPWTGDILQTSYPLMIGQQLPNVFDYNFRGILDDVRIYDYPLPPADIQALYSGVSSLGGGKPFVVNSYRLDQNYPNPFNSSTIIRIFVPKLSHVIVDIDDALGRTVQVLVNREVSAGSYSFAFNAANFPSGMYIARLMSEGYLSSIKMLLIK
ncbi:MAG: LamG-like jellyroll fold domain-containing protein [Candidatus Kryptoniota bacterium]